MGINGKELLATSFEDMAAEQENAVEVTATEPVTTEAGDKPCDCKDDEACATDECCKDESCDCKDETTKA